LIGLKIIKEPLKLLYSNGAVLIGMVYIMFPFMVMPIYTSVEKLDRTLLEAAYDLYASKTKAFINITWPLTKPGVMAGCLLVFVPTLGLFFIPDLMGGSKIILISNLIKNQFLTARDWPFGTAISVALMIVMLIIIFVYTKKGGKIDGEVM
jgi:ABC-type spermidine/putrescine transport system, permease component I